MDKMGQCGLKNSAFGDNILVFPPRSGNNHDREVRSNITFIINKVKEHVFSIRSNGDWLIAHIPELEINPLNHWPSWTTMGFPCGKTELNSLGSKSLDPVVSLLLAS